MNNHSSMIIACVDGGPVCVCDHSSVASLAVSVITDLITLTHCDHSQCMDPRSGWPLLTHPLSPSLARRLKEASGLARVRAPHIRTRTRHVTLACDSLDSLASLSLSSAASLSRQRLSLSSRALSLSPSSPSRLSSSSFFVAPLQRSSRFLSLYWLIHGFIGLNDLYHNKLRENHI